MTDVQELLESMPSAMAARPMPDFDDVVRRRRRLTRRKLTAGSVPLLLAGAAGAATFAALPGVPAAPAAPRLTAAASTGHTASQPTPQLADGVCSNVEVTPPADSNGAPDPVAASQQFARQSGDGFPTAGWHVVYQATNVAQVESGAFDAMVVRAADGSWQVRSAQRCD